jgi:hypothetical protein
MNNNIANKIVKALEAKGESKDYIIGFLTATLDGMKQINDMECTELDMDSYLNRTLKFAQG